MKSIHLVEKIKNNLDWVGTISKENEAQKPVNASEDHLLKCVWRICTEQWVIKGINNQLWKEYLIVFKSLYILKPWIKIINDDIQNLDHLCPGMQREYISLLKLNRNTRCRPTLQTRGRMSTTKRELCKRHPH